MRPPPTAPEFRCWRARDGYELRGRVWVPTGGPSLAILYLHGIQSHGGWFEWSAALLARSGCAVVLPDRRGSGLNQEARGDVPRGRVWLDDLDDVAAWVRHAWGVEHFGVVGVSWGGKLAVAWALRRADDVRRVLLIAPGLFPAVDFGWRERLCIGVALLARSRRTFPIPLDDPALFTDNPAGRAFIADDALKLTRATAQFLYESARLDRRLLRARAGTLGAETTLVLAGRDRILRNQPTVAWLTRLAARPPTVHMFPHAAHTIEFEPDAGAFGELLTKWAS